MSYERNFLSNSYISSTNKTIVQKRIEIKAGRCCLVGVLTHKHIHTNTHEYTISAATAKSRNPNRKRRNARSATERGLNEGIKEITKNFATEKGVECMCVCVFGYMCVYTPNV